MDRREPGPFLRFAWLLFAGAALGVFLAVYWRALPYPPVFDDYAQVIENRAIRYLFHPRIFLEAETARSRPLAYLTFAVSYWFSGLSLSGLRVVSLLVHAANAALVGLFYRRLLSGSRLGAVVAGALFLLHPLAADTVIYLTARGSLLVLFFLLLALLVHGRSRQGTASWLGFLFFAGLAFLSRESAAAIAPLLVASHWLTRRRDTELAPYVLPLVLGGAVILFIKSGYLDAAWKGFFTIQGDVNVRGASDYLRLSLSLWPRILGFLFLPGTLAIDHQLTLPTTWLQPRVLGGLLLWAGFAYALRSFYRGRSRWLFPVCWLFLSLLPTNSVFPVLDPLSERHIYIALPALAWLFALACDALAEHASPVIEAAALVAVLAAGATVTLARVLTWESQSSIWLSAHEQAPRKYRIALNAATSLLTERGDSEGALRVLVGMLNGQLPGAVRYEEETETADLLVGTLSSLAEDRGVAPRKLWEQLGLGGGYWAELVSLRAELGKVPSAQWHRDWADAFERVKREPVSPLSRDSRWAENSFLLLRARVLRQEGKAREALALYEKVILPFGDTHFPYWTAREELADLYMEAKREDEAIRQYELAASQYKVYKRFPRRLEEKLYAIFRRKGDLHRASDAIGELVRAKTDDPGLRRLYAELLRLRQDRYASRQEKEAAFYSRSGIAPTDPREILRP